MKTELKYLKDTYLFEATANIISYNISEGESAVILDQTIFYPQGGGQPTDIGTIEGKNFLFQVEKVYLDPNGTVHHYGNLLSDQINSESQVRLKVDGANRIKNAKAHSAGHLIDIASQELKLPLVATKGHHYPEGSYVEYNGVLENPQELIEPLSIACAKLISNKIKIIPEELSAEAAKQEGITAPTGKSVRYVYFDGYRSAGCGCGGTHLRSSEEIGAITIRKVKSKKGVTRVSYQIA